MDRIQGAHVHLELALILGIALRVGLRVKVSLPLEIMKLTRDRRLVQPSGIEFQPVEFRHQPLRRN